MRKVLATAALIAGGVLATSAFAAEPQHPLGGPVRAGNMCWVSVSANDQGYWNACPKPAKAMKKMSKKMKMKKS